MLLVKASGKDLIRGISFVSLASADWCFLLSDFFPIPSPSGVRIPCSLYTIALLLVPCSSAIFSVEDCLSCAALWPGVWYQCYRFISNNRCSPLSNLEERLTVSNCALNALILETSSRSSANELYLWACDHAVFLLDTIDSLCKINTSI